jgi:hypothetical protein
MPRTFPLALILSLLLLAGVPAYPQKENGKKRAQAQGLKPRRGECASLMPERDERRDVARLVRADQFLDCERDGYPKHLAGSHGTAFVPWAFSGPTRYEPRHEEHAVATTCGPGGGGDSLPDDED